jgi:hypothetical protein
VDKHSPTLEEIERRLKIGKAFAKLDLAKQAPYLSKQHENHLIELQASISKGDLKAMESQRTLKRTTDLLKNEIAAAGIDLTVSDKDKGGKKAKETYGVKVPIRWFLEEWPERAAGSQRFGRAYCRHATGHDPLI